MQKPKEPYVQHGLCISCSQPGSLISYLLRLTKVGGVQQDKEADLEDQNRQERFHMFFLLCNYNNVLSEEKNVSTSAKAQDTPQEEAYIMVLGNGG